MNHQEIIKLLKSEPSGHNIGLAKHWLSKKTITTKPVQSVAQTLLLAVRDKSTLKWFTNWLADKNWDIAFWAAETFRTLDIHDWLLELGSEHFDNAQVGKLWLALLEKYKDKKLRNYATHWFITKGAGRDAVGVAIRLLESTDDPKVIARAKALSAEFPEDYSLIRMLIERCGDHDSIELGLEMMEPAHDAHAVIVVLFAASLLKQDSARHLPAVETWFRRHWHDQYALAFICQLFNVAPAAMSALTLEWLEEHPQIANLERIYSTIFSTSPSQDVLDATWIWVRNHLQKSNHARMLNIVLDPDNELRKPPEALDLADSWLSKNIKHKDAEKLLANVLYIEATLERVEFARKWLSCHALDESGLMLLHLLRVTNTDEFAEQASEWRTRNIQHPISFSIFRELFKRNPSSEAIETARDLMTQSDSRIQRYFSENLLCDLVRLGDPESIQKAKSRLNQRLLEDRLDLSTKWIRGNLLLALLEGAAGDQDVIVRTSVWFESEGEVPPELIEQVRSAFAESFLQC